MLHREKPPNQAAYHEWVRSMSMRVYRLDHMIEGPMVPIDTPAVKGLTIYAVKNGNRRLYGAWIERSGVFIGWMRIQPHVSGIDSDYAVGEVVQIPVFIGIANFAWQTARAKFGTTPSASADGGVTLDLSEHDAVDKFTQALKEVAWD